MEEKTRTEHVEAHDTRIVFYVAKDGKEFFSERECKKYEDSLEKTEFFSTLKKADIDAYPFFNDFVYMESQDTIDKYVKYYSYGHKMTIFGKEIKVGDWVCMNFQSNPNGPDDYDLMTLEEAKTELEKIK